MTCLTPFSQCNFGATKIVSDITSFTHPMQFLMGLNDVYDHVRNDILVMDLLRSVNKA